MTHLLAVAALHLGVVTWLWTVAREVTLLVAITAGNVVRIPRLVALLRDVIFRIAVVAGALRDIGALAHVSLQLLEESRCRHLHPLRNGPSRYTCGTRRLQLNAAQGTPWSCGPPACNSCMRKG
jgi:hypothetical protein